MCVWVVDDLFIRLISFHQDDNESWTQKLTAAKTCVFRPFKNYQHLTHGLLAYSNYLWSQCLWFCRLTRVSYRPILCFVTLPA